MVGILFAQASPSNDTSHLRFAVHRVLNTFQLARKLARRRAASLDLPRIVYSMVRAVQNARAVPQRTRFHSLGIRDPLFSIRHSNRRSRLRCLQRTKLDARA